MERKEAEPVLQPSPILMADSVKIFIRDLGFPIFMAILLIYNSWTMQNYLISTNDKRDAQLLSLSEAVRQLSISSTNLQAIMTENNSILKDLKISAIVEEKTKRENEINVDERPHRRNK